MSFSNKTEVSIVSGSSIWFAGWLFTLGYADLSFWQGLVGLLVWPYFLGSALTPLGG